MIGQGEASDKEAAAQPGTGADLPWASEPGHEVAGRGNGDFGAAAAARKLATRVATTGTLVNSCSVLDAIASDVVSRRADGTGRDETQGSTLVLGA